MPAKRSQKSSRSTSKRGKKIRVKGYMRNGKRVKGHLRKA